MEIDFNGILFALSYALDCVEHDLLGVTTNHGKRVASIAIQLGEKLGVLKEPENRQILSACAVMHDCALSEYVQEEYDGAYIEATEQITKQLGIHCLMGEASMKLMPFDQRKAAGAVLYHHENADGSGPFGKKSAEIPLFAKLIQAADTVDARYDLSRLEDEKREKLQSFLRKNSGVLFEASIAEAFLELVGENGLSCLCNEKIDIHLQELLPGGVMECRPEQLIEFAGVFARIVDYKSHFTKKHSIGIAEKAREMAVFYGADETLAAKLYFAGALHDIGKLVVDRDVLEKPDKLTGTEYKHIQTHAYYSYKILADIPGFEDITRWASYHHEKLDGTGYPFGLTGDKLGRWERLMACLDIYQALTEERPYKRGMGHQEAIGILKTLADRGQLDSGMIRDIDMYFSQKSN